MPPPPTWWRCPRTRRRTPRASTPPCTSSTPPAARRSGSSGYPTAPSGPASATGCGAPLRRGDGDTTAREQSLFRDHPKDVILRPVTLQHSTARYFTGRRIYSRPSDPSFRSTTLHPDLVSALLHLVEDVVHAPAGLGASRDHSRPREADAAGAVRTGHVGHGDPAHPQPLQVPLDAGLDHALVLPRLHLDLHRDQRRLPGRAFPPFLHGGGGGLHDAAPRLPLSRPAAHVFGPGAGKHDR